MVDFDFRKPGSFPELSFSEAMSTVMANDLESISDALDFFSDECRKLSKKHICRHLYETGWDACSHTIFNECRNEYPFMFYLVGGILIYLLLWLLASVFEFFEKRQAKREDAKLRQSYLDLQLEEPANEEVEESGENMRERLEKDDELARRQSWLEKASQRLEIAKQLREMEEEKLRMAEEDEST